METKFVSLTKLIIDGYVYIKSKNEKRLQRTYWDCNRLRNKECSARAITSLANLGEHPVVFKGPVESKHSHPSNLEECGAEKLKQSLKRRAEEHPEEPPAQILRHQLHNVPSGVLSQLPERENLKQSIRRIRKKNLPPNPRALSELGELPDLYKRTLTNENFLIYDSKFKGEDQVSGRVLVFGTRRNLELLSQSDTWFLDGTFKVSPTIFTQLFTVLGTHTRNQITVALPMVYALLSSKEENQYSSVLNAIVEAAEKYRITDCRPRKIMTDFEKAIINACKEVFPDVVLKCCFFHLGQSVYKRVQASGLQAAYNDFTDRNLKLHVHMLLALAYVPVHDVAQVFRFLKREAPGQLEPVFSYFEKTYICVKMKRGGMTMSMAPRYPPAIWNQFEAASNDEHKTNNVSEGWHNRFHLLMGKNHPDLYSALKEFQKEQADTEIAVAEIGLGRKVKAAPKKKWIDFQNKIRLITLEYEDYVGQELEFLRAIAHNIVL